MVENEEQKRERKLLANKRINGLLFVINILLGIFALYLIVTALLGK